MTCFFPGIVGIYSDVAPKLNLFALRPNNIFWFLCQAARFSNSVALFSHLHCLTWVLGACNTGELTGP